MINENNMNTENMNTEIKNISDKRYLLSQREFKLLAGSIGIKEIYSFLSEDTIEDLDDANKAMVADIFTLLKKGYLSSQEDGEGYSINDEIRDILMLIKNSENVITISSMENTFCQKCIFTNEYYSVLIEPDQYRKNAIRMGKLENADMADVLADAINEEQYMVSSELFETDEIDISKLPDDEIHIIENIKSAWSNENEKISNIVDSDKIVCMIAKRSNENYEISERLLIVRLYTGEYILRQNEEETTTYINTEENLKKILCAVFVK